ncbi:MAG: helix-turn-helix transcriptional regulator [Phycisphaerae bacterium]|nr:helix-turn-helix transcriptional regulator [Phycisphaerae bacterium]
MNTDQLNAAARQHFEKLGISMNELCRRSGLGYATVHNWCSGARQGTVELATFVRIAEALGLDIRLVRRRKG